MESEITIDNILRDVQMNRDMLTGYVRCYMDAYPTGHIVCITLPGPHRHFVFGLKLGPTSFRYDTHEAQLEKVRMLHNVEPPSASSASRVSAATTDAVNAAAFVALHVAAAFTDIRAIKDLSSGKRI